LRLRLRLPFRDEPGQARRARPRTVLGRVAAL